MQVVGSWLKWSDPGADLGACSHSFARRPACSHSQQEVLLEAGLSS